ncbi:MAG: hypothetical protein JWQ96_2370 [Segetibacter sp.]|nr:hypothetical protein [Segetibacter sp.]
MIITIPNWRLWRLGIAICINACIFGFQIFNVYIEVNFSPQYFDIPISN